MKLVSALGFILIWFSPTSGQTYWRQAGLADTSIHSIHCNGRGEMVAISGQLQFLYISTDQGVSWGIRKPVPIIPSLVALDDSGFIYVGDTDALNSGLQRTRTTDSTWKVLSDSGTIGCYSLGVKPSGHVFATFADFGGALSLMYHSSDHGDVWMRDTIHFGVSLLNNLTPQLPYTFDTQGRTFVITNEGIFRSVDDGVSWVQRVSGIGSQTANTLCVNSRDELYLFGNFAVVGSGVFHSTDGGENWNKVTTSGLPPFPTFYQLIADARNTLYGIVAGTIADGIYRSTDDGGSWTNVSAGLPQGLANHIALAPNGDLFCATQTGIYRSTGALTSVDEISVIPGAFRLYQNYPNPFNPATTISYVVPVRTRVRLEIFDALGKRIVKLVDGEQASGFHSTVWDASVYPAGVYYYRVTAGSRSAARAMLLVK